MISDRENNQNEATGNFFSNNSTIVHNQNPQNNNTSAIDSSN
jgi:hypothetical protein